jgi:hypothetical protein
MFGHTQFTRKNPITRQRDVISVPLTVQFTCTERHIPSLVELVKTCKNGKEALQRMGAKPEKTGLITPEILRSYKVQDPKTKQDTWVNDWVVCPSMALPRLKAAPEALWKAGQNDGVLREIADVLVNGNSMSW